MPSVPLSGVGASGSVEVFSEEDEAADELLSVGGTAEEALSEDEDDAAEEAEDEL